LIRILPFHHIVLHQSRFSAHIMSPTPSTHSQDSQKPGSPNQPVEQGRAKTQNADATSSLRAEIEALLKEFPEIPVDGSKDYLPHPDWRTVRDIKSLMGPCDRLQLDLQLKGEFDDEIADLRRQLIVKAPIVGDRWEKWAKGAPWEPGRDYWAPAGAGVVYAAGRPLWSGAETFGGSSRAEGESWRQTAMAKSPPYEGCQTTSNGTYSTLSMIPGSGGEPSNTLCKQMIDLAKLRIGNEDEDDLLLWPLPGPSSKFTE
jgi:hypothetical protein